MFISTYMTEAELEQTIAGCRKGDREAQKRLFDRYQSMLMGIAFRYLNDAGAARDVVQESFIAIFEKLPTLRETGAFETWARRIVANKAINAYQKRRSRLDLREQFRRERQEVARGDLSPELVEMVDTESLYRAIAALPEGYRTVLNLYMLEGYSHAEIAGLLDIEEGTSRSQLHKAKKYLKESLCKTEVYDEE